MNQVTTVPDTARKLNLDTLDRDRVDQLKITTVAGGLSFATALEVMEFAKLMALSDQGVPPHLRKNAGMCLAVAVQAVEWRMSPFAVANKSYVVNDRIAYESQLVHAVVEARAPLKGRLNCSYAGEGPTRTCTVTGHFIGEEHPRTYTTPMFKDIPVKNSPLWKGDPDQQLFYYASRSWARKWAPDVLMGIYTREELAEQPALGREEQPQGTSLHDRLAAGAKVIEGGESSDSNNGHQGAEHAHTELDKAGDQGQPGATETTTTGSAPGGTTTTKATTAKKKSGGKRGAGEPEQQEPAAQTEGTNDAPRTPTTSAEYQTYAMAWIDSSKERDDAWARWEGEDQLRLDCTVSIAIRNALKKRITDKFGE